MIRHLRLLGLHHRLRIVDAALDRLQARHTHALGVGSALAAQRLQCAFDDLALTRAIVSRRIERLVTDATNAAVLNAPATGSDRTPRRWTRVARAAIRRGFRTDAPAR